MSWPRPWPEFESRASSSLFFETSLRIAAGIWRGSFAPNSWAAIETVRKTEGRGWISFFKSCSYDHGFCER